MLNLVAEADSVSAITIDTAARLRLGRLYSCASQATRGRRDSGGHCTGEHHACGDSSPPQLADVAVIQPATWPPTTATRSSRAVPASQYSCQRATRQVRGVPRTSANRAVRSGATGHHSLRANCPAHRIATLLDALHAPVDTLDHSIRSRFHRFPRPSRASLYFVARLLHCGLHRTSRALRALACSNCKGECRRKKKKLAKRRHAPILRSFLFLRH